MPSSFQKIKNINKLTINQGDSEKDNFTISKEFPQQI